MATPGEWYASLPVVTRTWGTACVATTAALSFGIVTQYTLFLDFGAIVKKFEVSTFARLFACGGHRSVGNGE